MQAKQAVCFDPQLTKNNHLQTNAFSNLVVVKQGDCPHALQKKATRGGATNKVIR